MTKRIVFQLGVYYLQQKRNKVGLTATNVSREDWETIGQTKNLKKLSDWKKTYSIEEILTPGA